MNFGPSPLPHKAPSLRIWAAATLAALASFSSETVLAGTSSVVGVYPISLPAGNSAWVSGLVSADDYEGAAAQVTADTDGKALVTFTSPGWTTGQFNLHYAEPQSGTCAGLAVDILSNTSDQIKLDTTPAAAGLTTGMVFIIRKHATLGTLIPNGGGLVPLLDSLSLYNSVGQQQTYVYNSAGYWMNGANVNSDGVVIRPGQGFVIHATGPLSLTIGLGSVCHVKSSPTKVRVSSKVPNIVGPLNPLSINTTIGNLGITGTLQPLNDSLVILTPGTLAQSGTYLSTGTNLINGRGQNANATVLPTGAGVVINADTAKNLSLNPVTVAP